jgi:chromosome segregation ATPase
LNLATWAVLLVAGIGLVSGCKDKESRGAPVAAAAAGTGEITKAEDDVLARRDALLKSRQNLRAEQEKLDAERKKLQEAGGDTTELDKRAEELRSQETQLTAQEDDLNGKLDQIIQQRRELMTAIAAAGAGNDEKAGVAAREAGIAGREKAFAGREERIAAREAAVAERERALALREKETCGVGATPTTIIQTIDAKGSKYTKKDVEPLLKAARSNMGKKGMLASDLPSPAQGLEKEATRAMADGDYGRARLAAQQLVATIEAQKIDRAFIAAKISRLSAAIKGVKLDGGKQADVDKLFQEATANYGDGDFSGANRRLNKIWAAID